MIIPTTNSPTVGLEAAGERCDVVVHLLNALILLQVPVEGRDKVRVSELYGRRPARQHALNDEDQLDHRDKGNQVAEGKVDRGKEADEDPVSKGRKESQIISCFF